MAFVCTRHQEFLTEDGGTFLLHVLLVHLNGVAFEQEFMREVRSAMYEASARSDLVPVPAP